MKDYLVINVISTEVKRNREICSRDPSTMDDRRFFPVIGCEESSLREGFFSRQLVQTFRGSNLTTIATRVCFKIPAYAGMTIILLKSVDGRITFIQ